MYYVCVSMHVHTCTHMHTIHTLRCHIFQCKFQSGLQTIETILAGLGKKWPLGPLLLMSPPQKETSPPGSATIARKIL